MEKCFADKKNECIALEERNCKGCPFYKGRTQAIEELEASPSFNTSEYLQELALKFAE